jgi:hypothetical protein
VEEKMIETYNLAELIVASWKLANANERIPTSHGILDRALHDLIDHAPDIPNWVKESLTFADTRVGLRCLELPAILDSAQESFLTSEPNPTYVSTAVKIDELVSLRILRELGLEPEQARTWGRRLKAVADDIVKQDNQRPPTIEPA